MVGLPPWRATATSFQSQSNSLCTNFRSVCITCVLNRIVVVQWTKAHENSVAFFVLKNVLVCVLVHSWFFLKPRLCWYLLNTTSTVRILVTSPWCSEVHLLSFISRELSGWSVELTTYLHLVSSLRTRGTLFHCATRLRGTVRRRTFSFYLLFISW